MGVGTFDNPANGSVPGGVRCGAGLQLARAGLVETVIATGGAGAGGPDRTTRALGGVRGPVDGHQFAPGGRSRTAIMTKGASGARLEWRSGGASSAAGSSGSVSGGRLAHWRGP